MERTSVTEKELLAFLNKKLHEAGHGAGCYFERIIRLRVDERAGCNWASAQLQCAEATGDCCPPEAEKIITEAKARFYLKD